MRPIYESVILARIAFVSLVFVSLTITPLFLNLATACAAFSTWSPWVKPASAIFGTRMPTRFIIMTPPLAFCAIPRSPDVRRASAFRKTKLNRKPPRRKKSGRRGIDR